VRIAERNGATGSFVTRYPQLTNPMWEQIRAQQQAFSGVFAWGPTTFNISPGGPVHSVQGLWVSGEFFDVLGIAPEKGRLLSPADDRPECTSAGVVVSHASGSVSTVVTNPSSGARSRLRSIRSRWSG